MEDTDFVACDANFEFNELKRLEWIEWFLLIYCLNMIFILNTYKLWVLLNLKNFIENRFIQNCKLAGKNSKNTL